jgi:transforming growth factor-beta-induced protein
MPATGPNGSDASTQARSGKRRSLEAAKEIIMRFCTRALALALSVAGVGAATYALAPQQAVAEEKVMAKKDIIETATGPGMQRVTTVVAAIQAAGLVDTLKGDGPFTVFAPTNEAFEKLPKGTVDDLLKPENKDKLTKILTFHVHAGDAIMAKDVKTMDLSTVNGKPLMVKVDGDKVWINNAQVIKTDVICKNGVIHWIDAVLMP